MNKLIYEEWDEGYEPPDSDTYAGELDGDNDNED